jgi:hypothetical protein
MTLASLTENLFNKLQILPLQKQQQVLDGLEDDEHYFFDPETQQITPLFHPQQQIWHEHFAWSTTASVLIAVTAI